MIDLPWIVAGAMLASLVLYVLLGGADFGGGVWHLFAAGPRRAAQRAAIEEAITPVWEANHVWLILIVVLLFTAFPVAFAVASIALHVPLTLMLVGIVLRGAAFVFRQYGAPDPQAHVTSRRRWGRVFALASVVTPVFLGISLGAVTGGGIRVEDGYPTTDLWTSWTRVFPLCVGTFALVLCAFLAAVYLTGEVKDAALQEDFRLRAVVSGVLLGPLAFGTWLGAGPDAAHFGRALVDSWWSVPLHASTAAAAVGALAALWTRRYRLARGLAVVQVALVVGGWGLAQAPYVVFPDLTVENAAAPEATLRLLVIALAAGSLVLFPALAWLFRVFKTS